ncbi:MAG: glycoside hydrolase family 3 N-terminal domain-containing protein [Acidobacteriota bacterium]
MTADPLSLKQKVGQLFFIGIAGPEIDEPTRQFLDEVSPGGVCLFARNIKDSQQTRNLLDELRELLPPTPLLSIDQEGGLVDRLRRVITPMPAASKIKDANDAAQLAQIIAETLRIHGFNMDFAPVVDVIDVERTKYTNGLFSRTFGGSKEDVTVFAGEFLRVLQAGGVAGCLKHFPGLAAALVDSHEELPSVDIPECELMTTDIYPYLELLKTSEVRAIMVAHVSFPRHRLQETDRNGKLLPSSLSYNLVTKLLRDELQFDGLVITDDLEMGAIVKNYGIGDACKMAVAAGVDMLAICADPDAVREGFHAVLKAVNDGEIDIDRVESSLTRIARVKNDLLHPLPFDTKRLEQISFEIAELNQRLNS